ncbi:uncharacterized protein LOC136043002 [Artemia franciscana]|uniref:Uncharacterized protein n=1 Tax=Artemia franciscana TaxID=6661 RepID=A0AA88HSG7_ARTSF|nr:hypothetical protein QYM36_010795 [Artemia franciscana]KAK2716349.1 hypothetical protein QYM36_010795 [Artemia franciscana]
MGDTFRVQWNGHDGVFKSMFGPLLDSELLTDVTMAARDGSLKCHKLVLAACSPYLRDLLVKNPNQYPILVLHDMEICHLKAIIHFLYNGEMQVPVEQMEAITKVCKTLCIRGFTSDLSTSQSSPASDSPSPKPSQLEEVHSPASPSIEFLNLETLEKSEKHKNSDKEESSEYESQTPEDDSSVTFPNFPVLPKLCTRNNSFSGSNFLSEQKGSYCGSFELGVSKTQSRTELKRYRQYTIDDISRAVDAIRNGMTIARASQAFKVPSRTLYDKVKKLGIPTRRLPKLRLSSHSSREEEDFLDADAKRKRVNSCISPTITLKDGFCDPNSVPIQPTRDFTRRFLVQSDQNGTLKAPIVNNSKIKEETVNFDKISAQTSSEEERVTNDENIDLKVKYFVPAMWHGNFGIEHGICAAPMDLSPNTSSKGDLSHLRASESEQ